MPAGEMKSKTKSASVSDGLIESISKGDKEALAELYEAAKAAVYGFALSVLRNASDAEDVMQDTFVRIYTAEYKPRGKPMAWILTVTRNLCLMKLRAGKRTETLDESAWETPDPRDHTGTWTDRIVLNAAMTVLTDEERQIVILHAVSGLKHREIASLLQIPLSTALSKYRRALSKLRKQLEETDDEE